MTDHDESIDTGDDDFVTSDTGLFEALLEGMAPSLEIPVEPSTEDVRRWINPASGGHHDVAMPDSVIDPSSPSNLTVPSAVHAPNTTHPSRLRRVARWFGFVGWVVALTGVTPFLLRATSGMSVRFTFWHA